MYVYMYALRPYSRVMGNLRRAPLTQFDFYRVGRRIPISLHNAKTVVGCQARESVPLFPEMRERYDTPLKLSSNHPGADGKTSGRMES